MYKVLAFLCKKEELTMAEFIDYYEIHHVPLVLSLAATPPVYKRRYLVRDQELAQGGQVVDFDVVTELGFADAEAFHRDWLQPLVLSEEGNKVIAEDEERFLKRERTRAYAIDERMRLA